MEAKMKLLKEYFKLQKEIFDYFGYVENYRVIPIEDATDQYWYLTGEGSGDSVWFAYDENFETLYQNGIYTQRFLPKWVYRGEEYTIVCVNTRTDGNKFLQVFSNSKESKEMPKSVKKFILGDY